MRLPTRLLAILLSLAASVALVALLAYESHTFPQIESDFHTYYQAAAAVRHGGDPYASVMSWITHYSGGKLYADYYVYAPFFALLLVPFTFVPFSMAVVVWGLCNILFLAGTVACTVRAAGRRAPVWALLALTIAMSFLGPVRMELQWGQADILLAFLVSASFLSIRARRPVVGGLLLALAAIVKPPVLALLLFYLWKRERRAVVTAALGAVVLISIPVVILGGKVLHDQLAVWSFWSSRYTPFIDNVSVKGVLARLLTHNPNGPGLVDSPGLASLLWIGIAVLCGVIALTMIGRRTVAATPASSVEFSLTLCTILIVSPLTEWIYLTLLAIPLLLCALAILPVTTPSRLPATARFTGFALLCVYGLLCAPLNHVEYHAWPGIATGGIHGAIFTLVAAIYLYPLVAMYGLCLAALQRDTAPKRIARLRLTSLSHIIRRAARPAGASPTYPP